MASVNRLLAQGTIAAAEHEAALASAYETVLGFTGRRAARLFSRLATRTLVAAGTWEPPKVDDVIDNAAAAKKAKKAANPKWEKMLDEQASPLTQALGVSFSIFSPVSQSMLDSLGKRAEGIAEGLREPVAAAIRTAYADGLSIPDTAKLIRAATDGVKGYQATMLARTDLISLANGGSLLAVNQVNANASEPVVSEKTWLSAGDDAVRPSHQEADGQSVPLEQDFSVGDDSLAYPGDPDGSDEEVINCRCTMLYGETEVSGEDVQAGAIPLEANMASVIGKLPVIVENVEMTGRVFGGTGEVMEGIEVPLGETGTLVVNDPTGALAAAIVEVTVNGDGEEATAGGEPVAWASDVAFENWATEDGRWMAPDSLGWRDLPLTLMAMVETTEGGHLGAQVAGKMETFDKQPATGEEFADAQGDVVSIHATGHFSVEEYGAMVARMVSNEELRGISVDLAINEWAFRDPDTGEIIDPEDMTDDQWEKAWFGEFQFAILDATIMAATVCPTPAFAEARIAVTAAVTAAGARTKGLWKDEAGQIMASVWAPFTPVADVLTAAAAGLAPMYPPARWFTDPELDEETPLTLGDGDDQGRIFGNVAGHICHTGYPDQCVLPPSSPSGYAYFHLGSVVTEEGDELSCGVLTLDTGHAGDRMSRIKAKAHYDDTGTAYADIVCGERDGRIWFSGALRPDITELQVRKLRGAKVSGDWRNVNGQLEMIAALGVNVPGFPIPRPVLVLEASADGSDPVYLSLVAAGIVIGEVKDHAYDGEAIVALAEARAAAGSGGLDALAELAGV